MKLKALIVDDEQTVRQNLLNLIEEYCPSIEVVGAADNAGNAVKLFAETDPDVIFLDIHMPGEDGFSVLRSVSGKTNVVFVTAYSQHTIRAIREGAFDYILKPIDVDELMACEQRLLNKPVAKSAETGQAAAAMTQLREILTQARQPDKISIHHTRGIKLVNVADIVRLSADDNYTTVHLLNDRIVVARPLKVFLQSLHDGRFFRVHRSHAINVDHMVEYIKDSITGYVIMRDREKIEISRRRSAAFIRWLGTSFRDIRAN